jgi:cytochrome c oxidase cbb3-type subunit 2
MPGYRFLSQRPLKAADVADHLKALRVVGVPYTDEMVASAAADLAAQADPDADTDGLLRRYPKAVVAKFNAGNEALTEMDALVAYLQMLGTLVRFTELSPADLRQ